MTDATFSEYYKSRYLAQQEWYSLRARLNRKKYMAYQAILLTMTCATTLLIAMEAILNWTVWKILALLSSGTATLAASLLRAFKYEENWINYRQTSEALKKEKYQFETGLDVYGTAKDPRILFVARVESLISRESDRWVQVSISVQDPNTFSTQGIVAEPPVAHSEIKPDANFPVRSE
jgi:hypothetical protein